MNLAVMSSTADQRSPILADQDGTSAEEWSAGQEQSGRISTWNKNKLLEVCVSSCLYADVCCFSSCESESPEEFDDFEDAKLAVMNLSQIPVISCLQFDHFCII